MPSGLCYEDDSKQSDCHCCNWKGAALYVPCGPQHPILQLLHRSDFAKEFEVYPFPLPVRSQEAATVHAGCREHHRKFHPVDGTCSVRLEEIGEDLTLDYKEPNKKMMKDAYLLPWPAADEVRLAQVLGHSISRLGHTFQHGWPA